jgi:hypothetical protein
MNKPTAAVLAALAGAVLVSCASVQVGQSAASERSAVAGTWLVIEATPALRAADGAPPPLRPEAKALYEKRIAARAAGDASFDRTTWCATPGTPRIMLLPYPIEIIVNEHKAAILSGWYRRFRIVHMTDAKLEAVFPTPAGLSTGRWEGDELVIRTVALRDDTILDGIGLPHSEDMTLTERLRLVNPDTLEIRFTIEDAAHYTQPWDAIVRYQRQKGQHVQDDVCLDRIKAGAPAVVYP